MTFIKSLGSIHTKSISPWDQKSTQFFPHLINSTYAFRYHNWYHWSLCYLCGVTPPPHPPPSAGVISLIPVLSLWCHTSTPSSTICWCFSEISASNSFTLSSERGVTITTLLSLTFSSRSLRSSGSGLLAVSGSLHEMTPAVKDMKPKMRNCACG